MFPPDCCFMRFRSHAALRNFKRSLSWILRTPIGQNALNTGVPLFCRPLRVRGARSQKLEDMFTWSGAGTMPGRTWIIAPDTESLQRRWEALVNSKPESKETLFHPHMSDG